MRSVIAGLLLLPAFGSARADSDGYYCKGSGFIAWETRFAPGPAKHVLHVVRFAEATGIVPTERIDLPDFQVHGMTCDKGSVVLIGWETRYTVDLTVPGRSTVTTRAEAFDTSRPQPVGNLGAGGKAGVVDLPVDGRTGPFELVVGRVSRRIAGGIDHHVVARLVQREPIPGTGILASVVLMEGIYRETIDAR